MGCFNYKCKCCNKVIYDGDMCKYIHVRDNKVIGSIGGHSDAYGRVYEQYHLDEKEKFRGHDDGINGSMEICKSEFYMNSQSGIVAYHKNCYENATDKEKRELTICKAGQWGIDEEDIDEEKYQKRMDTFYQMMNKCRNCKTQCKTDFTGKVTKVKCFDNVIHINGNILIGVEYE